MFTARVVRGRIGAIYFSIDTLTAISSMALKAAAEAGRVEGARRIREIYNIPKHIIDRSVTIMLSSASETVCTMRIESKPISFKHFEARQTLRGTTIRIKVGGSRSLIRGAFIGGYIYVKKKGASPKMVYIGERLGGHVFIRKGNPRPGRLPITKLATGAVLVGKLYIRHDIFPKVKERIVTVFQRDFSRLYRLATKRRSA